MTILISPSKALSETKENVKTKPTDCQFLAKAQELINDLKKMSVEEVKNLMNISDKLAQLNYNRFQAWQKDMNLENDYQAIYLFEGDVYRGLNIKSLNNQQIYFLQNHLRILSGLYGYLKPLDLMKPYRLEMGTKLKNSLGNNLYDFWQDKLTKSIKEEKPNFIINLASNEYSKSIKLKELGVPIITPIFKDFKNGKYKVVSFWAKYARGLMVRFIAQNQITDWNKLKKFNDEGYFYSEEQSNDKELVFLRKH